MEAPGMLHCLLDRSAASSLREPVGFPASGHRHAVSGPPRTGCDPASPIGRRGRVRREWRHEKAGPESRRPPRNRGAGESSRRRADSGRARPAVVNEEARSMHDPTSGASWKAGLRRYGLEHARALKSTVEIDVPGEEVWRVIAEPGGLAHYHPFCASTEVERWPGAGSRDSITYHSGIRYQRNFVSWHEGVGYDVELGDPPDQTAQSPARWLARGADARAASPAPRVVPRHLAARRQPDARGNDGAGHAPRARRRDDPRDRVRGGGRFGHCGGRAPRPSTLVHGRLTREGPSPGIPCRLGPRGPVPVIGVEPVAARQRLPRTFRPRIPCT